MPYGLWMAAALPVIAAGGTLHFKMKEQTDKRWNILPKCLSTWMVVCTAFLGIYQKGSQYSTLWILAALVLFFFADGLLEVHFFSGMAVFGAGHMILILWFIRQGHFTAASIPIWLICMAVTACFFKEELAGAKKNPVIYLMALYAAILMAMVSIAAALPVIAGGQYSWAAAGAVLFGISDIFVGKSFFKKLSFRLSYCSLALYYCGIFCIAMMTWAI
ncbi:MAG: hypothetical protein EOM40_00440 [Clostridia bacterium]|nr:hypothetical protein [Clostridia bacterium]NCC45061.1 hypothetical protein [Clostridia bacterium]